jgi:hypothetical protein
VSRSTEDVLADHWQQGKTGSVDDDLRRNYAADVACFTRYGLFHGHDGIRQVNERLNTELGRRPVPVRDPARTRSRRVPQVDG